MLGSGSSSQLWLAGFMKIREQLIDRQKGALRLAASMFFKHTALQFFFSNFSPKLSLLFFSIFFNHLQAASGVCVCCAKRMNVISFSCSKENCQEPAAWQMLATLSCCCFKPNPTSSLRLCFCSCVLVTGAKEIDIAATLEHLRDQRPGMVQTKVTNTPGTCMFVHAETSWDKDKDKHPL